jgi:SAM-dependent methyltransferase
MPTYIGELVYAGAHMPPLAGRALTAAAIVYARASGAVERARAAGDRLLGAMLAEALTAAERGQLGIALYDVSPRHRGCKLLDWEPPWLARRLPPPPARILVGACGAGREALALAEAGYAVDAFDPAASLLALLAARAPAGLRVGAFRYQDLAAAVLDGAAGPAGPSAAPLAAFAAERYDAVLLGWASLSHVLDGDERRRLLRAVDRLCPTGPILASFWSDEDQPAPVAATRAEQLGQRLGRALARVRRLPAASSSEVARESFVLDAGFLHRFSRTELDRLAAAAGRTVAWEPDDGGAAHVTLLPGA